MSPDEIASIREMIGELRGQLIALIKQVDQFSIAERLTHERLAQLKQDFGTHLAYHKMLQDANILHFSRRTALLAAVFSIVGALIIAILNFVLTRLLIAPTP